MGRSLGLDLVAEGVESHEQAAYLQTFGYPVTLQGFLYSKPCDAERATAFIHNWYNPDPIIVPNVAALVGADQVFHI
jgi:EAL domain-containing protein (putative c-di-GMP-specific phosphodiesterase class I)